MDEDEVLSVDDIDVESREDSPQESLKRPSSGLTLILPSLKSLQQSKGKKSKSKAFSGYLSDNKPKRPPRPAKLKPLKEVLTKLIANIKKKDDYGFFLEPVDVGQVQGYKDIVKHPMDLGTISTKVARGKYRSLEDFTNDVRLVTSNAKLFNPVGTIYHTEADKLEIWALEHIEKASATVIQYETDWNLDVEQDDAGDDNMEEENDPNAPSTSAAADMGTPGPSDLQGVRRSTRGPYNNKKSTAATTGQKGISESLDAEGRLPGSKDGLGAFPPGSDLAKTMLDLKLKGKRYKTKKERMRIEKEGPPFRSDGSLDYYNMEDPFSMFTGLVPAPLSRPVLTPIYTPRSTSQSQSNPSQPPYQSQSQTPQPSSTFPIPATVPLNRPLHTPAPTKGRHWVVSRNSNYRRNKDKDDDDNPFDLDWNLSREAHATDFGSLALLAGELAEEMKRRGISGDDEQKTMDIIKDSLDCAQPPASDASAGLSGLGASSYWNTARAAEAEDYIRDVVYGGVEGLAYVRSLAEFVSLPEEDDQDYDPAIGMPLAKWVEVNVVDPLTGNRHSILRKAARQLNLPSHDDPEQKTNLAISSQVSRSLHLYPQAYEALRLLLQLRTQAIDMASLIRTPEEIYLSEKEWFGNASVEQVKKENSMEVDVSSSSSSTTQPGAGSKFGSIEQLNRVFVYVANAMIELDKRRRSSLFEDGMKADRAGVTSQEDPVLRNLRLNLLALAKRAPLDTLALLPRDLIPEHIRHVIPTLTTSTPT